MLKEVGIFCFWVLFGRCLWRFMRYGWPYRKQTKAEN